ncbi:hypothetical protein DRO53_04145 [Candidatus Bathyarchaeota archaeon]|nr:MAG: hypothetical protein DRO53_04145 [Candidatus Bathyarchaeota archaeon]
MEVEVELIGFLSRLAGKRRFKLNLEAEQATVLDLVKLLGETFGRELERNIVEVDDSPPRKVSLILVNDVEVSSLQGLETVISAGDRLTIIPVSHGG